MHAPGPGTARGPGAAASEAWCWSLVRSAGARARTLATGEELRFGISPQGVLVAADAPGGAGEIVWRGAAWQLELAPPLVDLYLPVCSAAPARPLTVGHLGQSLDGYVATDAGDSNFVTGLENIVHLHRMRALADAVVVGAGTVAADDPQLTVRRVEGDSPVRVVIDPRRGLSDAHRIFRDGLAPTLLVTGELGGPPRHGEAEVLCLPAPAGRFELARLVDALHGRGLHSIFVEGGGATVSGFLEAGLLDRLQIAVAPMLTGRGRPALRLPPRSAIADCLRPAHRVFAMGADLLFDCDLRAASGGTADGGLARGGRGAAGLRRIS